METESVPVNNAPIQEQKKTKTLPITLIISVIVLLLVIVVIRNPLKKSSIITPTIPVKKASPTPVKKTTSAGSFTLKTSDGLLKKNLGESFTINVLADSKSADIVGYDLLIDVDASKIEIGSMDSILTDFSLYKTIIAGKISITGVKKLNSNSINVLNNQPIVSLTFKPKVKGNSTISIVKERGKEVTEMIDKSTKIYYPEISSINIEAL